MSFWDFLFYGIIIVGAIFTNLTIKPLVSRPRPYTYLDSPVYRRKKEADKKAAAQKAKEKEKQLKRQKRVDKLNHYRAINGKGPVGMDGKPVDKKKK